MDWRGIIDYVGVPAILKDVYTGGRRLSQRVHDVDDLIQKYDESDTLTVIVQEILEVDEHLHCFVIGRESVLPVRYSVKEECYLPDLGNLSESAVEEASESALKICNAYGYEMNMVEFSIQDESVTVINPTNPAPDMDINLLKPAHFSWCVSTMADYAIAAAKESRDLTADQRWYQALRQSA